MSNWWNQISDLKTKTPVDKPTTCGPALDYPAWVTLQGAGEQTVRGGADPLTIGRIGWGRAGARGSCLTVQRAEEKQECAGGGHAEDN